MESEAEKFRKTLEKDTFHEEGIALTVKPTDRVGREGFTLVHWTCHYGRTEALQHFLSVFGAAELVTAIDIHGWTPSHVCAIRGTDECLQLLIENGADVTTRDHREYTCGHCAAIHGNTLALQRILNAGHDVNIKDGRLWTVVHHAAFYGRYQTLQMLAQLGGDLLSVDQKGNMPAHLSASEGHLECLRLLVFFNCTPSLVLDARNNRGATPKDLAIQFQKSHCADFLATAAKEVKKENEEDTTPDEYPVHHAASIGNLQLLTTLIVEGQCDVNARDGTGSIPAHKAAGSGHLNCLKWLIDNGTDLSITNNLKESPLDVAKKYGKTHCIALIEKGIGIEQSCNFESLEQAKTKLDDLKKMLAMSTETYLQLGGVLEEDKHQIEVKEMTERHAIETRDLENKLELEREKRELLEREVDMLRLQLHQTNETLLHYKALLSVNNLQEDSDKKMVSPSTTKRQKKRMTTTNYKRTGGAYIDLNPARRQTVN